MKIAEVYQTKDSIIFCANAKTIVGIGLSCPPYIHLQKDATDEQIFLAMNTVIEAYKNEVPHPKQNEWNGFTIQFLEGLQIKSMTALYKKAVYCLIEERGHNLFFIPTTNEGIKGGFTFIPNAEVCVSRSATITHIVNSLKKALYLSSMQK